MKKYLNELNRFRKFESFIGLIDSDYRGHVDIVKDNFNKVKNISFDELPDKLRTVIKEGAHIDIISFEENAEDYQLFDCILFEDIGSDLALCYKDKKDINERYVFGLKAMQFLKHYIDIESYDFLYDFIKSNIIPAIDFEIYSTYVGELPRRNIIVNKLFT